MGIVSHQLDIRLKSSAYNVWTIIILQVDCMGFNYVLSPNSNMVSKSIIYPLLGCMHLAIGTLHDDSPKHEGVCWAFLIMDNLHCDKCEEVCIVSHRLKIRLK